MACETFGWEHIPGPIVPKAAIGIGLPSVTMQSVLELRVFQKG